LFLYAMRIISHEPFCLCNKKIIAILTTKNTTW
jgi:hypothetical protein